MSGGLDVAMIAMEMNNNGKRLAAAIAVFAMIACCFAVVVPAIDAAGETGDSQLLDLGVTATTNSAELGEVNSPVAEVEANWSLTNAGLGNTDLSYAVDEVNKTIKFTGILNKQDIGYSNGWTGTNISDSAKMFYALNWLYATDDRESDNLYYGPYAIVWQAGAEEPFIQYLWGAESGKTVTINKIEYKLDFSGITFNTETVAVWGDGDINATLTGDAIVVNNYTIITYDLDGTENKNSVIKTANGSTITILDGVTLTINANVKDGATASVYAIDATAGNLTIAGDGKMVINVNGETDDNKGGKAASGIYAGSSNTVTIKADVTIMNNATKTEGSGSNCYGIYAKSITFDGSASEIYTGNRAIYFTTELNIENSSNVTVGAYEKGIRGTTATSNVTVDAQSTLTANLLNAGTGVNAQGNDDRFGIKTGAVDIAGTVSTEGLRVFGTGSTVSGILNVVYNANGGAANADPAIPAGLVMIKSESSGSDITATPVEITVSYNGTIIVEAGNSIIGEIKAGNDSAKFGKATAAAEETKASIIAVDVSSVATFSVGSLNMVGGFESEEPIVITGETELSGTYDVPVTFADNAKVTVPAGEELIINSTVTMGANSTLNALGDVSGTGKIDASANGSKVTSTSPQLLQSMVTGATVTSSHVVGDITTGMTSAQVEALAATSTALQLTGDYTVTADLALPSHIILYLNGNTMTVNKDVELTLNGTEVRTGAPESASTAGQSRAVTGPVIDVIGTLILDGADVYADVIVDEDNGYVALYNTKTMTISGQLTTDPEVGYGNKLILSDVTIPSGRAVSVYGDLDVQGTVTVVNGAKFEINQSGSAVVTGTLKIEGAATVNGEMTVNGTLTVSKDEGGASFTVGATGDVTVSENAAFTVSKPRMANAARENILDVQGKMTVEGTLTVTGTMAGTIDDKGSVVFNGKSNDATVRIYDGVSITITSVTGTITVTDADILTDEINTATEIIKAGNNSVVITNAKGVTVGEVVSYKLNSVTEKREYTCTMTVTGTVTAVDDTGDYSTVQVSGGSAVVGDLSAGKNVKLVLSGSADITVTGTVNVVAQYSKIEIDMNGASVKVEGSIVIGPQAGKDSDAQELLTDGIDAVMYEVQDAEANSTYYYTNLATALAAASTAFENTLTVYGEIAVKDVQTIAADVTVTLYQGAVLTIEAEGSVTVATGANLDGANGKIVVEGVLTVDDRNTGLAYNTGKGMFVYQVYIEAGDKATYMGLVGALNNAASGDVITLMQSAEIDTDLLIKEGVTLVVPRGVTLTIGDDENDVKLTVNGTLTVQTGGSVVKKSAPVQEVTTVINGVVSYVDEGSMMTDAEDYAEFTARVDGKVTNFMTNLTYAAQNCTEGTITVHGDLSAGDISLVKGERADALTLSVPSGASVSVSSVTIDGAEIVANGKVTGSVIADAAGATATIDLASAYGFTIRSAQVDTAEGAVDYLYVVGTTSGTNAVLNGDMTIAAGTVTVSGGITVGTTKDDVLTVAEGAVLSVPDKATIIVDETATGTAVKDYAGMVVDGELSVVKGTLTVNGITDVNGALTIEDTENVSIAGTMNAIGTVAVNSTEDKPAELTVSGKLILGDSEFAAGELAGPVDITSDGFILAFPGADVSAAEIELNTSGVPAPKTTQYYVNGDLYMTAYANQANTSVTNDSMRQYVDIAGYYGVSYWYANEDFKSGDGDVNENDVGDYPAVYAKVSAVKVPGTISVGTGLTMYIDGLTIDNWKEAGYYLTVGTHTVTIAANANYNADNATITFNGQTVANGGTITIGADDTTFTLSANGATAVTSGGEIVVNTGSDDMSLTDILLIVLVVLIVIMAIIVALRLMRS